MAVSSLMEIGKNALLADQVVMGVIGQNITNVNTPGYSRQTAQVSELPGSGSNGVGAGIIVSSVTRSHNEYLQQQMVTQQSLLGFYQSQSAPMTQMDQLFNDLQNSGVDQALLDFTNAYQDLANNPTGVPERDAVLAKANTLVDSIHQVSASILGAQEDADITLQSSTQQINTIVGQIASLNGSINATTVAGENANALMDQRDQLIQDLALQVGINYTTQGNGMAAVTLTNGLTLVSGTAAGTLSLAANAANNSYSDVILTQPGSSAPVDITPSLSSGAVKGALGGTITARDVTLKAFMAQVDEFTYNLATKVNSVQSAGYGLTGSTGLPLFTPPAAPVPPATYVPGYSRSVGGIQVAITAVSQVAASSTDPTAAGNGVGNNVTALAIADLASTKLSFSSGMKTLGTFYGSIVGRAGVAVQTVNNGITQSSNVNKQLVNLQQSESGVSSDEELANLISYQQAYQAAAKIITVGQQMMDTVLGLID